MYLYLQTQTLWSFSSTCFCEAEQWSLAFGSSLHFNYSCMKPVTQQTRVSAKRHSHARQSKLCAASLMYVSREPSQVQAEYPCSTHKNRGKIPNPSRLELLDSGVRWEHRPAAPSGQIIGQLPFQCGSADSSQASWHSGVQGCAGLRSCPELFYTGIVS